MLAFPLAIMFLLPGCSGVKAPVASEPEQPFAKEQAKAAQYEQMIAAMDPYVTQTKDGQYVFDEAGFKAAHSSIAGSDLETVLNLQKGIPIANQKIQEMNESPAIAKIEFYWYWWGYKECYSELSAVYMLDLMSRSGYAYPIYLWAQYYYYHYSRFCINHTWAGGIWITG